MKNILAFDQDTILINSFEFPINTIKAYGYYVSYAHTNKITYKPAIYYGPLNSDLRNYAFTETLITYEAYPITGMAFELDVTSLIMDNVAQGDCFKLSFEGRNPVKFTTIEYELYVNE